MNLVIGCLHVVIKFASVRPFLPTLQIGAFGAVTALSLWCRTAKCCLMLPLGPAAGGIVSLLMLLVGLLLSDQGSLFQVPAEFSRGQFW